MAVRRTTYKLNNGREIPGLGLGTWLDEGYQHDAVRTAIKSGYRHIDTAEIYGTEEEVGRGIKETGIPRDQIFITTKLWSTKHHPDDVPVALEESLKRMDCGYLDLFIMHYPTALVRGDEPMPKDDKGKLAVAPIDFVDTWKAMEKLLATGKVKSIGVSNFSRAELERLLRETDVAPAVHQFEHHPWLQQSDFVEFNQNKGIHVTAYSPLGNQNQSYTATDKSPPLISDPVLIEVGKKYNKSPAQIALAWSLAKFCSVIVKSKTPARINENFQSDFELSPADINAIDNIDKKHRFNDLSESFNNYELFAGLDGKK